VTWHGVNASFVSALLGAALYLWCAARARARPELRTAVNCILAGAGVAVACQLVWVGGMARESLGIISDMWLYLVIGGLAVGWVSCETIADACRGVRTVTATPAAPATSSAPTTSPPARTPPESR
jgi:hypothetical protein